MDEPILNIRGHKVGLGPHRRDLLPLYLKWINDFEVVFTLDQPMRPTTVEAEQAWLDRVTTSDSDVVFTIYELATARPIGTAGLHAIDHRQRTATFGVLIGEKDAWGRGYGTEATRLTLEYAFVVLGLHNIMLQVYEYNQRGVGAYLRAGFREIGRRREARRWGDRAYDIILMDCLATEFEGTALKHLLPEAGDD